MKELSRKLFNLIFVGLILSSALNAMQPPDVNRIRKTMAAARDGNLNGVALFVRDFPEFWNWVDDGGSTLTHKAAGHGQREVLEFLLIKDPQGNSLSKKNSDHLRPLDLARNYNHDTIARRLEARHKELGLSIAQVASQAPQAATSSSSTQSTLPPGPPEPFEQASSSSSVPVDNEKRELYKSIAILQREDISEGTRLQYIKTNIKVAPRILTMQDDSGRTLLNVAAEFGRASIVSELLNNLNIDFLVDPNKPDKDMNTPLAKAIMKASYPINAAKRSQYDTIINELVKNGGTVFAKAFIRYQPTKEHQDGLAKLVKEDILHNNLLIAQPVSPDNLHINLAYISVPMKFPVSREDLRARWQSLNSVLTNFIPEIRRLNLAPGSTVEPLGSYLVINYSSLPLNAYSNLINGFYRAVLSRIPDAQKTYPEINPPHVSIAKANAGITDRVLAEKARAYKVNSSEKAVRSFHGSDDDLKLVLRVPSLQAPGYEDFSF